MTYFSLKSCQTQDSVYRGELQVNVTGEGELRPVENASVIIQDTGNPEITVEETVTNISGQTSFLSLPAPDPQNSLQISIQQPYSEYNILVQAPGYESKLISGAQILPGVRSLQNVTLSPITQDARPSDIVISPHTLYGEYPPKIPEAEIKPLAENGEIVLSRVVIPEYIVVHDGVPSDPSASDYYVRYKDYIKNVTSSEIYATWPESTIYANILAIMSFTLNRVYTEWYRNRGYNFTITSSTAYDQKWIKDRNIYENIDYLVDSVFANYLSRPGVRQPLLTGYCDGYRTTCNGLSQWGSKSLGDRGYSAINILRYYYGSDIYINTAENISGIPASWPGYTLTVGSSGQKVQQLQQQLARISRNFPAIPSVTADGVYGPATREAVRTFQQVFHLPATGDVDYTTWYTISDIYVGVTKIAEPGAY
ncbi:MAG: peptidoglycan-binding protein [Lachnospiraceae bacterium]|nr:peptidoglycan-binding protein [Lachnospiraceae bacterium]